MATSRTRIARGLWWFAAVLVLGFVLWDGLTSTMYDIDVGCAKIAGGGPDFRCEDRVLDVLGP